MLQSNRPILAIDLGRKRFGVALCPIGNNILPLTEIDVDAPHATRALQQIQSLVAEHSVLVVVVGLPLHSDGDLSETAKNQAILREKLQHLLEVPLITIDEHASTIDGALEYPGIGKDSAAAMAILQRYLEETELYDALV